MLEALVAMSIGKLILLGVLALIVGIPALVLLVGMVVGSALFLSPNPPWKDKWNGERTRKSISLKTRALGWGMFFIAVALGILVAVASNVQIWGMVGFALLFGGIALIIFYFIASKTERKTTLFNQEED